MDYVNQSLEIDGINQWTSGPTATKSVKLMEPIQGWWLCQLMKKATTHNFYQYFSGTYIWKILSSSVATNFRNFKTKRPLHICIWTKLIIYLPTLPYTILMDSIQCWWLCQLMKRATAHKYKNNTTSTKLTIYLPTYQLP